MVCSHRRLKEKSGGAGGGGVVCPGGVIRAIRCQQVITAWQAEHGVTWRYLAHGKHIFLRLSTTVDHLAWATC